MCDEAACAALADDQPALRQSTKGAIDGHASSAEMGGKIFFGGNAMPRGPIAGMNVGQNGPLDLIVDGAGSVQGEMVFPVRHQAQSTACMISVTALA